MNRAAKLATGDRRQPIGPLLIEESDVSAELVTAYQAGELTTRMRAGASLRKKYGRPIPLQRKWLARAFSVADEDVSLLYGWAYSCEAAAREFSALNVSEFDHTVYGPQLISGIWVSACVVFDCAAPR